jgi:hypothetical protein
MHPLLLENQSAYVTNDKPIDFQAARGATTLQGGLLWISDYYSCYPLV